MKEMEHTNDLQGLIERRQECVVNIPKGDAVTNH